MDRQSKVAQKASSLIAFEVVSTLFCRLMRFRVVTTIHSRHKIEDQDAFAYFDY
jgi:hypothetical protein